MSVYLNNVLSSYNHYLVNLESIRKSHFDLICRNIRPEQVILLILSDKKDTPNESQLFRSFFSIEQFIHLRALKFIKLDDDGESFFSDLYKIEHLVSFEIDVKINLPLIRISPILERLTINIPSGIYFDLDPSIAMIQLEQLRHLSLSNCSCKQLQKIFYRAIRLTSLKVCLTFLNAEEIDTFTNFHQEQTTKFSLVSLSLSINAAGEYRNHVKYIHFPFFSGHTIMQMHLERFLAPLQRLRRLELITSHGAEHQFLDAYRWEIFIIEHFPQLLTFNFKFFSRNIDRNVIDQYRRPFWLDKHWYVACDSSNSFLYTVPYFAPTSINHSSTSISPDCTTLPIEQHFLFYDCVTELRLDSGRYELPYRYNYVKKLILNSVFIHENVLDLSKVKLFIINTSEWSLYKIMTLIEEAMPSVNYLGLNCTYPSMPHQHFPNISLKQIRILCLPQYGKFEDDDQFNWSRLFPSIERLIVSINSKSQIKLLIYQFKNMISGFFYIDPHHIHTNKQICITHQWLEKHLDRSREKNTKNFIYQINNQFLFSLSLWISENDEVSDNSHVQKYEFIFS
jgi:hypothetical protein